MRISPHERTRLGVIAELESTIHEAVGEIVDKQDASFGELLTALTGVANRYAQHLFREEMDEADDGKPPARTGADE